MENKNSLIHGNITKGLIAFTIPFLFSYFLQTFYGMADLMIVGLFEGASSTSAVSIGSQFMHMVTVLVVGLAMGVSVHIGHCVGAKEEKKVGQCIGTSIYIFGFLSILLTILFFVSARNIAFLLQTPKEALEPTIQYLKICSLGIPWIIAYNVIASIFRGLGDSKRPLYFVAIACVVNLILDYVFIGFFHLSTSGAALATIIGQAISVLVSLILMKKIQFEVPISKKEFHFDFSILKKILYIGTPIAFQDGMIQISFLIITIIANSRGLIASSSVGIVEKVISFFFLVPSAFLSSISTMTAQNMGANQPERAKKGLFIGMRIAMLWGIIIALYCQFFPETFVSLFTKDVQVIHSGCEYLRSYVLDTFFASIHFCFSGYFCGSNRSGLSFIHNIFSILLFRIPGAYLASLWWPSTLYPMGLAPGIGSIFSVFLCVYFYKKITSTQKKNS
ncbi:MAG: MATE family efflux transporter [Bacillota bacterium]|nr:MATE family efflux transporter [Bacillota bacterium]